MKTALIAFLIALALHSTGYAVDRALIVGVEKYRDPRVPGTPGCEADARAMEQLIRSVYKFTEVRILINEEATASNIERWFRSWLITGTRPGDRVFFFYAGHGSQIADDNGDERKEDGKDETLAPYDVDPRSGENMIRDDLFDEMIGKLSGRRAVLVFDSCHSGTISRGVPKLKDFARGGGVRYLPTPEQFAELEAAPSRGAAGYVVKTTARRDLVVEDEFIEPQRFSAMSGAVIISAAGDRQLVYPMLVDGRYRGGLSYALIESLQKHQPRLRDLEADTRRRIRQLQTTGRLEGNQQPVSKMKVSLIRQDKRGNEEAVSPETTFYSGASVRIRIQADQSGFLYIVSRGSSGKVSMLYPNRRIQGGNNQIVMGKVVSIPTDGGWIKFDEKPGTETLYLVFAENKTEEFISELENATSQSKIALPAELEGQAVDLVTIGGELKGQGTLIGALKLRHQP